MGNEQAQNNPFQYFGILENIYLHIMMAAFDVFHCCGQKFLEIPMN